MVVLEYLYSHCCPHVEQDQVLVMAGDTIGQSLALLKTTLITELLVSIETMYLSSESLAGMGSVGLRQTTVIPG